MNPGAVGTAGPYALWRFPPQEQNSRKERHRHRTTLPLPYLHRAPCARLVPVQLRRSVVPPQ